MPRLDRVTRTFWRVRVAPSTSPGGSSGSTLRCTTVRRSGTPGYRRQRPRTADACASRRRAPVSWPTCRSWMGRTSRRANLRPEVRDFYEHTSDWRMEVWTQWNALFQPGGELISRYFGRRVQQLALPTPPSRRRPSAWTAEWRRSWMLTANRRLPMDSHAAVDGRVRLQRLLLDPSPSRSQTAKRARGIPPRGRQRPGVPQATGAGRWRTGAQLARWLLRRGRCLRRRRGRWPHPRCPRAHPRDVPGLRRPRGSSSNRPRAAPVVRNGGAPALQTGPGSRRSARPVRTPSLRGGGARSTPHCPRRRMAQPRSRSAGR